MAEISPETLGERVQEDDDLLVLDVRHEEEYDAWKIPGSVNVDVYDELSDDPGAAKAVLADLPDETEIVTVCAAGIVAETATDVLEELGYDAETLADGMAGWSRVHRNAELDVELDGTLIQVARPGKGCLSYVLVSGGEAAVFDPSHYLEAYESILESHDAELVGVFDTHAHADHLSGGRELADRYGVPYYLHPADALSIEAAHLSDGDTHAIGSVPVTTIHTPGHSPGGVTYDVAGEALLTGDTLFHDSVGRVELGVEAGIEETDVEANAGTLYESLDRLCGRGGDPLVLPAHDPGSPEPPVSLPLSAVESRNDDLQLDREAFVDRLSNDVPDHPPNFERVKSVNVGEGSVPNEERSTLELGPNRCAAE